MKVTIETGVGPRVPTASEIVAHGSFVDIDGDINILDKRTDKIVCFMKDSFMIRTFNLTKVLDEGLVVRLTTAEDSITIAFP